MILSDYPALFYPQTYHLWTLFLPVDFIYAHVLLNYDGVSSLHDCSHAVLFLGHYSAKLRFYAANHNSKFHTHHTNNKSKPLKPYTNPKLKTASRGNSSAGPLPLSLQTQAGTDRCSSGSDGIYLHEQAFMLLSVETFTSQLGLTSLCRRFPLDPL